MAEFKEVMHQIARMCRKKPCCSCNFYNVDNGCMFNFSTDWLDENSERIEKEVDDWAAANTEPVYPS